MDYSIVYYKSLCRSRSCMDHMTNDVPTLLRTTIHDRLIQLTLDRVECAVKHWRSSIAQPGISRVYILPLYQLELLLSLRTLDGYWI